MPKNCNECLFFEEKYDPAEHTMFGSGYYKECYFNCTEFANRVRRPEDCPLKEMLK